MSRTTMITFLLLSMWLFISILSSVQTQQHTSKEQKRRFSQMHEWTRYVKGGRNVKVRTSQQLPASSVISTTTIIVTANATIITTVVPIGGSSISTSSGATTITTTTGNINTSEAAATLPVTLTNSTSYEQERVSVLTKVLRNIYYKNYDLLGVTNASSVTSYDAALTDMRTKGTPQYEAAQWILYGDNSDLYASYQQIMQRYVLAIMYFSTSGPTQWLFCSTNNNTTCDSEQQRWLSSNTSECVWYGIQCNNSTIIEKISIGQEDNMDKEGITSINLNNNNLIGTLPQELSFLKNITDISLSNNLLSQSLPPYFPESITKILLNNNTLTGSILDFSSRKYHLLETFNVADNLLSGTIPRSIGHVQTLQILKLEDNLFWGTLSKAFGALTQLKTLTLQNNGFSGTIPLSLCYDLPDIVTLEADCASPPKPPLVTCPCCTDCYSYGDHIDNNDISTPTTAPITVAPSGLGMFDTSEPTFPMTPMPTPSKSKPTTKSPSALSTSSTNTATAPSLFGNTTVTRSPTIHPAAALAPSQSPSTSTSNASSTLTPTLISVNLTTSSPTASPITNITSNATVAPSLSPTNITSNATVAPSLSPTNITSNATVAPSLSPTNITSNATVAPSLSPISSTSNNITLAPTSLSVVINRSICKISDEIRREMIQQVISDATSNITSSIASQGASTKALEWILEEDPTNPCPEDIFLIQRYALTALYFSTNGDRWERCSADSTSSCEDGATSRWLSDASECTWDGNECSGDGSIVTVTLEGNNLAGQIPQEIGLLVALKVLRLPNNTISGELPTSLGNIAGLGEFDVGGNRKIGGTIPEIFFSLVQLRSVSLMENQLTGSLSPSIGRLTELLVLELQSNDFTGTIPFNIGNLTQLTRLNLQFNGLTGSMPEPVCLLRNTSLNVLEADCQVPPEQVSCLTSCCTACFGSEPSTVSVSEQAFPPPQINISRGGGEPLPPFFNNSSSRSNDTAVAAAVKISASEELQVKVAPIDKLLMDAISRPRPLREWVTVKDD